MSKIRLMQLHSVLQYQISPLTNQLCSMVAQLHLTNLRTYFGGMAGQKLLESYYVALAECEGAAGYVAASNSKVLGYVCGVWKPEAIQQVLIKRFWLQLFFWGSTQVFLKPRISAHILSRISKKKNNIQNDTGYELRPIVVAPKARGSGIAVQLVETILCDAACRGFKKIYLYTEDNNEPANAFYRKMGFHLVSHEVLFGHVHNRYEGSTERYL